MLMVTAPQAVTVAGMEGSMEREAPQTGVPTGEGVGVGVQVRKGVGVMVKVMEGITVKVLVGVLVGVEVKVTVPEGTVGVLVVV
jgi:hypothetical protein